MFIAILIFLNLPIYLLVGWLIFDDGEGAAVSFWETIVMVLKRAFIPPLIRYMIWEGQDDEDGGHFFKVLGFFVACIAITVGEWYAITTWLWPGLA